MRSTLAWARTFPPSESEGWTIHFIERESRYWIGAQAGRKEATLFEQGTQSAWNWVKEAQFVRWFTDGERRYAQELWKIASIYLKVSESHSAYGRRKTWREGKDSRPENQGLSRPAPHQVGEPRASFHCH